MITTCVKLGAGGSLQVALVIQGGPPLPVSIELRTE